MAKRNNLKTSIVVVLLGVLAASVLGGSGWTVARTFDKMNAYELRVDKQIDEVNGQVDDHETRLAVVEVVLDRIDENVKLLLEKP